MRTISVAGPFDLNQALAFLNGFAPSGPEGLTTSYQAAHVLNGRALLVRVFSSADGRLVLELKGPAAEAADVDVAERLVRRLFSLDWDGNEFYDRIGRADPVMGRLQERFPGLRPVLFGSPFEALCWAIISQRITMVQAARAKARLAAAYGPSVEVSGEEYRAFPAPEHLLALDATGLGLPGVKVDRLRTLAARGVQGDLEAERLLAMEPEAARAWLEQSPGIGPWASEFALLRGVGHPDLPPYGEQRLLLAVQRYYRLDREPTSEELEQLGERWTGYRSWAAFLLRVALQIDSAEPGAPAGAAMRAPHPTR